MNFISRSDGATIETIFFVCFTEKYDNFDHYVRLAPPFLYSWGSKLKSTTKEIEVEMIISPFDEIVYVSCFAISLVFLILEPHQNKWRFAHLWRWLDHWYDLNKWFANCQNDAFSVLKLGNKFPSSSISHLVNRLANNKWTLTKVYSYCLFSKEMWHY